MFPLSLAAGKLLMMLLEGEQGRGNLGEPWAAEGGADGREAQISDHQVPRVDFYFCFARGQDRRVLSSSKAGKETNGICEKSLWQ